jgi:hypothetical protein
MLRKILEKGLQVFLSSVVAFAVDYAFAEAIEAGLLMAGLGITIDNCRPASLRALDVSYSIMTNTTKI